MASLISAFDLILCFSLLLVIHLDAPTLIDKHAIWILFLVIYLLLSELDPLMFYFLSIFFII